MEVTEAINTLTRFAQAHAHEVPPEEQIPVYHALAVTLPTLEQRQLARQLAVASSQVAALQLEFSEITHAAKS
jgi:hypothetical protein